MPGCPFAGAGAAAQTSGQSAHAEGDVSACPAMRALMAGNGGAAPPEAGAAPPDAAPTTAAVCPLGFGSSRGPRLSTLHCTLCRGLLHEPVTTDACSHTFCRACITRARDCVICGADIKSLSPNEELERLVQTFLDTHSKSPQLVAAQADLGPLPDDSSASFFMAQGLKSLGGGNLDAARHLLGRSRSDLVAALANGGQEGQEGRDAEQRSARVCQLATVCGCLGDCAARMGDAVSARAHYEEAVSAVEAAADNDADAAHALSVSLIKLADLHMVVGDAAAARPLCERAVSLRERAAAAVPPGGAGGSSSQLDLAAGLAKLADAAAMTGNGGEADGLRARARGIVVQVGDESDASSLAPGLKRKLSMLQQLLSPQQQQQQ